MVQGRIPRFVKNRISGVYSAFRFGFPTRKLKIIGVTGTDGKTTTATLIYWILKQSGKKVGLVTTVGAKIQNENIDTGFHVTMPGPSEIQRLLSKMVKANCEYAVLEVTSHGLDQERDYGVNFEIGVLTNITHEHLDYHKTFKNYVKAKAKLFSRSGSSILNRDYSAHVFKFVKNRNKTILYDGKTLVGKIRQAAVKKFVESYNFLNATAAILAAKKVGIPEAEIIKALKTFPGVEGRMQDIKNSKGIRIIVDFAHTPNALESVLKVLKKQVSKSKKLIAVFGCAGERDVKKRPMMARISSDIADISVFTAEDPRSEDVAKIISQMEKGIVKNNAKIYKILDRGEAINFAINKLAKRGDVVVICGKGHEMSMSIKGAEYSWSDKEAVLMVLKHL